MKVILKKPQWSTMITTLYLVIVTLFVATGCDKSENPPASGDIDSTLFIGEWDCIKFAYIADDKTISDVAVLSKGYFIIPNMEDKWTFVHTNEIFYEHSISGNLIKLTMRGSTFILPPQEEIDICEALKNAYSFAIKDNELMIYFTGIENKNLLIFKKR